MYEVNSTTGLATQTVKLDRILSMSLECLEKIISSCLMCVMMIHTYSPCKSTVHKASFSRRIIGWLLVKLFLFLHKHAGDLINVSLLSTSWRLIVGIFLFIIKDCGGY